MSVYLFAALLYAALCSVGFLSLLTAAWSEARRRRRAQARRGRPALRIVRGGRR